VKVDTAQAGRESRKRVLACAAVAGSNFLVYSNSLRVPFLLDDASADNQERFH
jgi:hypothetical protein